MGGPDFVLCPLVDTEIENIDCIENSDTVDGMIKKDTIPERFKKKPNWEKYVKNANGMDVEILSVRNDRWDFIIRRNGV